MTDSVPQQMSNGAWFIRVNVNEGMSIGVLTLIVIVQLVIIVRLLKQAKHSA